MSSFQEYKRRVLLPLAGAGLAAYYLLVFLPLAHKVEELDGPLRNSWKALALALEQTNAVALDFQGISNRLHETRAALGELAKGRAQAAARFQLGPELRGRMKGEFLFNEFDSERRAQMEELTKLAKEQQVTIEPAVWEGFPIATAEAQEPALLWPSLAMVQGLLSVAVRAKVSVIHSLDSPSVFTNGAVSAVPGQVAQIPLQIELTGPVAGVFQFLRGLPLRGDELAAAGLPAAPPGKLPLLIDRLVLRKQSPDKPDEVRLSLRVVGFVFRE